MPEARDGDTVTYQTCTDPTCPNIVQGYEHAHLVGLERAMQPEPPRFEFTKPEK